MVLAFHVHILVIPQMCPLFLSFFLKSFYQNVKDCVQLLVAENPINSDNQTAVLSFLGKNSGAGRWADRWVHNAFRDPGSFSFCSAVLAWLSSSGRYLMVPRWLLHLQHHLQHSSWQEEEEEQKTKGMCQLSLLLSKELFWTAHSRTYTYSSLARTVSRDQP